MYYHYISYFGGVILALNFLSDGHMGTLIHGKFIWAGGFGGCLFGFKA